MSTIQGLPISNIDFTGTGAAANAPDQANGFGQALREAVTQIDQVQGDAQNKIGEVMKGSGGDVHSAMIAATARARVKLMIAYRLHFEAANLEAERLARQGKLGDLRFFSSDFCMQVRDKNILFDDKFVPAMLAVGRGSVINMASIGGIVAVRERLAYTATKFAVVGLTKALALDHSHTGVRFNCICPGRVETPFVRQRLAESPDPEKAFLELSATQLTGRMAQPSEIAAAALFLAADEAAMVTGSSLMVDGGWSAGK